MRVNRLGGVFLRNMQMGDLAQAVKVMGKESEGVY
jgi:hypothetical protein